MKQIKRTFPMFILLILASSQCFSQENSAVKIEQVRYKTVSQEKEICAILNFYADSDKLLQKTFYPRMSASFYGYQTDSIKRNELYFVDSAQLDDLFSRKSLPKIARKYIVKKQNVKKEICGLETVQAKVKIDRQKYIVYIAENINCKMPLYESFFPYSAILEDLVMEVWYKGKLIISTQSVEKVNNLEKNFFVEVTPRKVDEIFNSSK